MSKIITNSTNTDVTNISRLSINTTTEFIYTTLLIIMWTIMIWITSLISKLISLTVNIFNLGTGNTLPGYLVLKLFPNFLKYFSNRFKEVIIITGTNGKTTTSKLMAHALRSSGVAVVTNNSGSNLLRGIVTSLLLQTNFFGKSLATTLVLEVDEFNLPKVLESLPVTNIVLLNISRDQLDRYGETDIIFNRWVEALRKIDFGAQHTNIHCFSDQPEFADLRNLLGNKAPVRFFGPASEVLDGTVLKGLHNQINAGAVVSVLKVIGVNTSDLKNSFKTLTHAYGRGERVKFQDSFFTITLAKNPASYNHNLDYLLSEPAFDAYLLILNDKIPDGRDVSWIYDIDSSKLQELLRDKVIFVSGTRYLDMTIRLHYLGIETSSENIGLNPEEILKKMLRHKFSNVCVLPNYSAMLEIRKLVVGRSIL